MHILLLGPLYFRLDSWFVLIIMFIISMSEEKLFEIESVNRGDYSSLQMSLYFFLLIFFILLNYVKPNKAINSTKVISSVRKSFGNSYQPKNIVIDQRQESINSIASFYKTKILDITPTNFEILEIDDGLTIVIRTDTSSFFVNKSSNINELQKFFLSDLQKLLSQKIPSTKVITQITLGTSNLSSDNAELKLNIDRIVSITDYLVRSGVNIETIEEKLLDNAPNLLMISLKLVIY
jgi:hypothetical protein